MRANKLENPTLTRFILPQHQELLLQMQEDKKLVPMPVLEQDELEAFHYHLLDAGRENYAVTITWWRHKKHELGITCTMFGKVEWIDMNARQVKLLNDENAQWIPMDCIISVRS